MSTKTSKTTPKATAGSTKGNPRYYTEGVIKELCVKPDNEVRFTLSLDKEYSIETEHKGEKKTCAVFRPECLAECVCGGNIAGLYAGDFIFSASKDMTFDKLLLIKVNACHLRIYVEGKDSFAVGDTPDEGKPDRKSHVQVSEIRLKQK